MTQREIADVLGVDHRTVGNDLRAGEDSPADQGDVIETGEDSPPEQEPPTPEEIAERQAERERRDAIARQVKPRPPATPAPQPHRATSTADVRPRLRASPRTSPPSPHTPPGTHTPSTTAPPAPIAPGGPSATPTKATTRDRGTVHWRTVATCRRSLHLHTPSRHGHTAPEPTTPPPPPRSPRTDATRPRATFPQPTPTAHTTLTHEPRRQWGFGVRSIYTSGGCRHTGGTPRA